ncbi:MAG: AAA family ATPase, partial [Oscillochloris sp.]|nr:AAA family ATPase [Oscillochloris sp.]
MIPPDPHVKRSKSRSPRSHHGSQPISTPGGIAGVSAVMIGRDSSLQQLLARLYTLLEGGDTQLITILGEPGIGKSRLAYEFYQQVARMPDAPRFYRFKGDPQRSALPHGLIRQLITTLFEIDEDEPQARAISRIEQGVAAMLGEERIEEAHILGYLAGLDLEDSPHLSRLCHDVRQIRERAIQAAMQIIAHLTSSAPMVLVIDDFQDVDDSSIDMIERAAQIGHGVSLMIICLSQRRLLERRPHWGEQALNATRIDLQHLDEHQSRRLVGEILRKAGKLPTDLRNLIVRRAEGNPLYIEELIKMLVTDGVILPGDDKWQIQVGRLPRLRIPSTLSDLLRARLAPLGPLERSYLAAASVAGSSFWVGALAAMLGQEPTNCAQILQTIEAYNLIASQPESSLPGEQEYRFSHDLLREAIYD